MFCLEQSAKVIVLISIWSELMKYQHQKFHLCVANLKGCFELNGRVWLRYYLQEESLQSFVQPLNIFTVFYANSLQ